MGMALFGLFTKLLTKIRILDRKFLLQISGLFYGKRTIFSKKHKNVIGMLQEVQRSDLLLETGAKKDFS